jgi:hypothetical protein
MGMVYETYLKPTPDGRVFIDLQDVVNAWIDLEIPSRTAVTRAADMASFWVKYRRVSNADPNPSFITTESGFLRTAIKGGVEDLQASITNYFAHRYANVNAQPFATWVEDSYMIGVNDDWFISWLCYQLGTSTSKVLEVKAYNFAGTLSNTVTRTLANNGADVLYHLPVGVQQLGLLPLTGGATDIWYYTLQVKDGASSTVFSPLYTIYIDYRPFKNAKVFHYINSLGGIDNVRILGEYERQYAREYFEGERTALLIDQPGQGSTGYYQSSFKRVEQFAGDAGYRYSKNQVEVLNDILLSEMIWERFGSVNRLVFVMNKQGKSIGTTDRRFGFPIEWRYAAGSGVYTPPNLYQDIACFPVSFNGPQSLPDAQVGVPYTHTIELMGTPPFALSAGSTKPAWMTIAIDGSFVTLTGTPPNGANTASTNVSFTITNCTSGTITLTDTIAVAQSVPVPVTFRVGRSGDAGVPNTPAEDVTVYYSINGGLTWTVVGTVRPNKNTPYPSAGSVNIPDGVQALFGVQRASNGQSVSNGAAGGSSFAQCGIQTNSQTFVASAGLEVNIWVHWNAAGVLSTC